jgi:chromosome segregation ATPase
MASQNDTIVDTSQLTHDDLLDAYEKLANSYRINKNELDEKTQQLHSQIQHRKIFENSLNDLQSELDQVNSVHAESLKQNEKKLDELKEKNLQLTIENQTLGNQVDDCSGTIKELKLIVENLNKELLSEKTIKPRISDSFSKCLENENEELRSRNNELEIRLQEIKEKVSECQSAIEEYREKIQCMDENIESKKVELEEKNEVIEHMQEKMHELSTELATLRNTSELDDGSKFFLTF